MRFLNASVLERKALNRILSWGFPLGNLLPKTRVLKHRVLERKRRLNANASVLGTQRFRTLSFCSKDLQNLLKNRGERNWAIAIWRFLSEPKFRTEFPSFLGKDAPNSEERGDLYEPLLTAMAQVLPSMIETLLNFVGLSLFSAL